MQLPKTWRKRRKTPLVTNKKKVGVTEKKKPFKILRRPWVQILDFFCQFFFFEKSEVPAKKWL